MIIHEPSVDGQKIKIKKLQCTDWLRPKSHALLLSQRSSRARSMWLRRARDGGVVQKKGKWVLGSQTDTDVRLSSPNFQDQPQLCPPERQFSRQGGFPTQLFPARRPVEVRVHPKRDPNSGWGVEGEGLLRRTECSWRNGGTLSHLVTLTPQASSPSTRGLLDKSHQARLPPVRPGATALPPLSGPTQILS